MQRLVLSEVFPPKKGGSGKWLYEVYRRQQPGTYTMVVGSGSAEHHSDAQYPQRVCREDLSMAFRGVSNAASLRSYWSQVRRVSRIAKEKQIDMIHAARPLSEGLVARFVKLLHGVPYLCYIHGEDVSVALTSRELRYATGFVLRSASLLVANSNFTRDLLINEWGVSENRIALMHPGVDSARFEVSIPEVKDSPQQLVILTVGRLQRRKGQDTVIRAIPRLLERFPKLTYVIAGEGEERDDLVALAQELGVSDHVRFEGEIDDERLLKLYAECDVFVLLNRAVGRDVEGFGMVLLEAQAAGKPVIAGDSGGTRDTLLVGETGYIIDGKTPDDFVRVVSDELCDAGRRAEMGFRGREYVRSKFDWSSLAVEASRVFDSATVGA